MSKFSKPISMQWHFALLGIALLITIGCSVDQELPASNDHFLLKIPQGFINPLLPEDNLLSVEKIALGKQLFFDPILSVDSTISCSSCHQPEHAFSDNVALSKGVNGLEGFRNATSLANIAWEPVMLRDGGNPTIETQIYVPLEDVHEMNFNMALLINRLQKNTYYAQQFLTVFGKLPDAFEITRSIAAFERTIISGNSRFDMLMYQNNPTALNESELNGLKLFFSDRLNCSACHSGFTFSNHTFQNNGLYLNYGADSGRARITGLSNDVGKFKIPTLRNIEVTAPYMHDGSLTDLSAVIDFYSFGAQNHSNKSTLLQPFTLSVVEKNELIQFLNALTDTAFLNNVELSQ